jgi:hypothetical protein
MPIDGKANFRGGVSPAASRPAGSLVEGRVGAAYGV